MILRQVPGLDPAAGLLVVVVAVGVVLLAAARADRCRGGRALRVVVGSLVVLVVGKEQGGRVIRGRGGSTWRRACCPPGRADLRPGCSTWCRACCRIAGGVAGVRLVVAR